jgi:acetyltransferase EpsM
MNPIYLYGGGGHAKVVAEIIELQGKAILGIFDENLKDLDRFKYPFLGSFDNNKVKYPAEIIICVGNNAFRKKLVPSIGVQFGIAVHPSSIFSSTSTIGEGSVVMAGAVINSEAKLGNHVIINTLCCVEHDCTIGNFVHISPHAALAGGVQVGEGSQIGIGACVIQGIKIGKWCTIGAGSVIIRDIPDGCTVVGNPGRVIKRLEENSWV